MYILGELFINHELNRELQIIELGSTTKDAGKVHILDIGSTKKEYQLLEYKPSIHMHAALINFLVN
jgi:hypothetical protein